MTYRHFLIPILYIGMVFGPLFTVFAQEIPLEPANTVLEEPIASSTQPEPEPEMLMTASEEEHELVWGCAMESQYDAETDSYIEVERCGLGYYRTLCGSNEGVPDCVTFFEFYEEPIPEPDPVVTSMEEMQTREHLSLHLSWNGLPLGDTSLPAGRTGTLGWSYTEALPESSGLSPTYYHASFEEMVAAATLTLQVYRGPIGSATLIYSSVVTGTSGEIPLTLSESGEYHAMLVATYSQDTSVPGYVCGGEICPTFDPRIESFTWFMEHARAYFDGVDSTPQTFYEYGSRKTRVRTYTPLTFGMSAFSAGDAPTGPSNVLFLPGIKGSRLYKPSSNCSILELSCPGVKLWEPSSDVLLSDLFLNADGSSNRNDIYVKEGDIVSDALGVNFYASFVNQMNALKADGTLTDWKAIAYDWRLSLDDIVENGVKRGDKIYFQEETDTPYIEESLKTLAASSPTGKVSIIAHSNGGLVTKRLMQKLEAEGNEGLVDKIILVGVPQSGAPQAMAGLLYGYGEALPYDGCSQNAFIGWACSLLGSRPTARTLAEHSPMAYHLLPSDAYFAQVQDFEHPIAKFTGSNVYSEERARYGSGIYDAASLHAFLANEDGGRTKPATEDIAGANILSSALLSYGRSIHQNIDAWVPPENVQVYQIAGWGMETVVGVEFYEQPKLLGGYKEMYRPMFVEDGDGVVPIPSALMLGTGLENVQNYWVNLRELNRGPASDKKHGDMFELDTLRVMVRNILIGNPLDFPENISRTAPPSSGSMRLVFFLHSPLTLELFDRDGNHVGENADGSFDDEIPDAEYGEFGDVKYIIAPADEYHLALNGKSTGTFSLDVQSMEGDNITSSFTIADVPTTESTVVTMEVKSDLSQFGTLQVDADGDGTKDIEIKAVENSTVIYENPSEDSLDGSARKKHSFAAPVENSLTLSNSETPEIAVRTNSTAQKFQERTETDAGSSEQPEKTHEGRTQTASVYDAITSDFLKQFFELLYNFWKTILEFITNFLSRK